MSSRIHRFVHLSDLHLRLDSGWLERVRELVCAIEAAGVDHLVLSGDVTHRGRRTELELFTQLFAARIARGRITVVPGNHDRNGDDVHGALMDGPRIQVSRAEGLYLVRVNSTGAHNRSLFDGRGLICRRDIAVIADTLCHCPRHALPVIVLHHHLLPLPDDKLHEQIAAWLGVRYTAELELGRELLDAVRGLCPLVLHGHRHLPAEQTVFADARRAVRPRRPDPIRLFNAGCSPALGAARLFIHSDGDLVAPPLWIGRQPTDRLPAIGPPLLDALATT